MFSTSDGFEMTAADQAEWQRPLQAVGHFLIGRDGLIRWARVETSITALPPPEELLSLVCGLTRCASQGLLRHLLLGRLTERSRCSAQARNRSAGAVFA